MTDTTYLEFLASKRRQVAGCGPPGVSVDDTHGMLHDWQSEIVAWTVRKGRAAIFADCGLGKTFMQLEWSRLVSDRTLWLCWLAAGLLDAS